MSDKERISITLDEYNMLNAETLSQGDTIARLTARVKELEEAAKWTPTHRHLKRGSTYQVVGTAELQASHGAHEGDWLTVYRAQDGKLWARPTGEFIDGRFETLPPPPQKEKQP